AALHRTGVDARPVGAGPEHEAALQVVDAQPDNHVVHPRRGLVADAYDQGLPGEQVGTLVTALVLEGHLGYADLEVAPGLLAGDLRPLRLPPVRGLLELQLQLPGLGETLAFQEMLAEGADGLA